MARTGFIDFTPPPFSVVYFRTRYDVISWMCASTSKPSREQRWQQTHRNYRASRFWRLRPCCRSLKGISHTPSRQPSRLVCRRVVRSCPRNVLQRPVCNHGITWRHIPPQHPRPVNACVDPRRRHSSGRRGLCRRSFTSAANVSRVRVRNDPRKNVKSHGYDVWPRVRRVCPARARRVTFRTLHELFW